jgi:hypothetical protein
LLDIRGPRRLSPPSAASLRIASSFAPDPLQGLLLQVIEALLQFLVFPRRHIVANGRGLGLATFALWGAVGGGRLTQEPAQEIEEDSHQKHRLPNK